MYNNILLFTKNYPPQIGGIENYSFNLYESLKKEKKTVRIITTYSRNTFLFNNSKKNFLYKQIYITSEIFRLSYFFFKCATVGLYYSFYSDLIWGLDGSLGGLVILISSISGKKTRLTLHGTDLVWNNKFYQFFMPFFWFKIDEFVAVSPIILQEALKRRILSEKITIKEHSSKNLTFLNIDNFDKNYFLTEKNIPTDKIILFSLGRFVEIKGFHWFISEVLPFLTENFYYVLGGFGPFLGDYIEIIRLKNLKNISIIGPINDLEKAKWFLASDYFIMPNISSGGVEGFGIVLLEAHYYKKKSIIPNIYGINLRAEEGDITLPPGDSGKWIETINQISLGKK